MINTIFHFVNDPTFDYQTAVLNGDISEYTIVFNAADRSIHCKNQMYGRMSRADIAEVLGDMSDLLPAATDNKLGAVKLGYRSDTDSSSRRYALKLDENNRGYVEVPWTDTVTPAFDDSELQALIDRQRARIDSYINDVMQTVQECTETLLQDTQWVTDNLAEGEVGRQINDNLDEYMRIQYGVWDWVDDNDHSRGKVVRTSVIEQEVDSLKAYTGMTIPSGYSGTNLTTALSRIYEDVGRDFETGEVTANTGMMADIADLNTETGAIDQAIISALDLKAKRISDNQLEAITDLASVYSDNTKQLYSGLNTRVTTAENNISAESSLLSRIVNSDGTTNSTFKSDVISGLATEVYVRDLDSSARTQLISDINGKSAGITVFATKTGNAIDTGITLNADQITLSGITLANTVFAGLISADTVAANYATINSLNAATGRIGTLETASVRIEDKADTANNKADAANNAYIELAGGNGTFTGNVYANAFRAGSTSGFNITVESDSINFNYADSPRAWFSTKKYVASANGPVEDTSATNAGGFYLYMISPETGNLVTIDFANLTFKEIVSGGRPTPHTRNLVKLTNGSRNGEVKSETYTVYYSNDDGNGNSAPIAYYSDPALTTPLTNAALTNVYMIDDPEDYYNNDYHIAILLDDGSYQAKEPVTRYRGVSMNGTDITTSGGYVYTATYGSGSNTYNRYCTPSASARSFSNSDLINGNNAYSFSGGSTTGTYYIQYATSKTTSTGAMSFFRVNDSATAMDKLQVSAVS